MAKKPVQPDCCDYVRNYYGVPARAGMRVRYLATGKEGVIVRKRDNLHYIHVKFDGASRSVPCHPTWEMEYIESSQPAATHEDQQ
jgi:hypothetical protein